MTLAARDSRRGFWRSPGTLTVLVLVIVLPLLLVVHPDPGVAQEGVGVSSASFLRNEPGPRSIALGGASSALADDGFAMFQNPAGLSNLPSGSLAMTQTEVLGLIDRGMLGLSVPMGSYHTLGVGGRYLQADDTVRTERETGESFSNEKVAAGVYYALGAPGGLSVGLGAKGIRQTLYEYSTTDYAMDGGLHYNGESVSLGAVARNVGSEVRFVEDGPADPMPETYAVGLGYRFSLLYMENVLSLETTRFVPEGEDFASVGLEMQPFSFFTFRVGARNPLNVPEQEASVRGGLGIRLGGVSVDYSFTSRELLSDQHNFSITLLFGSRGK